MGLGASRTGFIPDDNLKFRGVGASALLATFTSTPLDLKRLTGYWNVDEIGLAQTLMFAVGVEAAAIANGETYTFTLEIDADVAFGSPTVVDTIVLDQIAGYVGNFDLSVTRTFISKLDSSAAYVRLKMVPAGVFETGTIVFSSTADDGDTVTINDGTHTATVFTFGDGTGGTVNKGASATNSAQNLKAAINGVGAGSLNVTAAGASTTLTITNNQAATGGTISKSDGDNDFAVTNFSGGHVASIQFWGYVRGPKPGSMF